MTEKITNEFLAYRNVISSLLSRIRPQVSQQDIEDILQETYINVYQSSKRNDIFFPKAFMVKTAIRLANRSIKLAQRSDCDEHIDNRTDESLLRFDSVAYSSKTENDASSRQDFGVLCEALDELPRQCRKVFILKKVYGLSQREIAEKLNISESTVEKHVAKGLLRTMRRYDSHQAADTGRANSSEPLQYPSDKSTRTKR